APGPNPGDLGFSWHIRGTSNATALTSRAACLLHDVVEQLADEPGGELIDQIPRALWVKTLLVHGARWGPAGDILTSLLRNPSNSRQFKEYLTRLLGYGVLNEGSVSECTETRVTGLSG